MTNVSHRIPKDRNSVNVKTFPYTNNITEDEYLTINAVIHAFSGSLEYDEKTKTFKLRDNDENKTDDTFLL